MESPLIESFEVGNIHFTTNHLVACDPLTTSDMEPFQTEFPLGEFPVLMHAEIESNCIAYVEIVFQEAKAIRWQMATTKYQHLSDLKGEEIFGYPGESGMGCIMDSEAQHQLQELEQKIYAEKGDQFCGIYEEFFRPHFFNEDGAINQYAFLKPNPGEASTIFAFETGFGDGFYASYIAFDENDQPVKIISEFIEIEA